MKKKMFVLAGLVGLAFGLLAVSAACGGGGGEEAPTATVPAPTATGGSAPSVAELAAHFTTLKAVLQDTIAKAEAGDVQGTRDAEGQGDEAIEAIIDALRPVDSTLADQIENLELDYEEQADSDSPDLAVIAQAAQGVLDLLDQAAAALGVEVSAPSAAELAAHFTTLKAVLEDTIAKAEAGDVQGTRDAEGQGDEAIEAIIDALRPVDSTLADQIENLELDYEEQADSDSPDLAVIAQAAQGVLDLLDQAAAALGVEVSATTTGGDHGEEIAFDAASATITVDGDSSDWDAIQSTTIPLEQIDIPAGVDWDEPGAVDPIDATLKVATDSENVYVLFEVPDDYDFVADDHGLSAALAVMFLIDPAAGPHMGAVDEDLEQGLGMVDIWHWELDCGAGVVSGGGGVTGGDDPTCNLDDEYATDPETREDDGDGDVANPAGENSLVGVWEHTARAAGTGADGTWIFEFSRPLQTGDPQDAQFASGGTALMALAYWDADETATGWTDNGHLQSAENGWIEVTLP